MTIEQIRFWISECGLTLTQRSSRHWQVTGGIALVNVYSSRKGFTIHVQGMAKGQPVKHPSQIAGAAKQFKAGTHCVRRKRCIGVKNRKWNQMIKRNGKACCHWCQREFKNKQEATADHVIPVSKGGSNGDDNIVLACEPCNTRRRNNVTDNEIRTINRHE